MARTLHEKLKALPIERQEKINRRTSELIEEEMSLRDLRKSCGLTQERIAESLGIPQESVSRLERRSDLLVSTLRNYVEAMGGEMYIVVKLPQRPAIRLTHLPGIENMESESKKDEKKRKLKVTKKTPKT